MEPFPIRDIIIFRGSFDLNHLNSLNFLFVCLFIHIFVCFCFVSVCLFVFVGPKEKNYNNRFLL